MTDSDPAAQPEAKGAPTSPDHAAAPAAGAGTADAKPVARAAPPARVLPSQEEIAEWIAGAEIDSIGTLFEDLALKRYDTLATQLGKADLLPQHWQAIARHGHPEEDEFHALAEIGRLRARYGDGELADRRVGALLVGWRELRGKRPSLWTVPDLLAALRRIIAADREVDRGDLLAAVRDVWRDNGLPQGKENLDMLWSSLSFLRTKIKK
jgi:hypothetical protein